MHAGCVDSGKIGQGGTNYTAQIDTKEDFLFVRDHILDFGPQTIVNPFGYPPGFDQAYCLTSPKALLNASIPHASYAPIITDDGDCFFRNSSDLDVFSHNDTFTPTVSGFMFYCCDSDGSNCPLAPTSS